MTDLETAIADVSLAPWSKADVDEDYRTVSIILNAVASGDLITREAADARAGARMREVADAVEDHYAKGDMGNAGHWVLAISPDATAAYDRAVKAAREDERERCAKLCDEREQSAWEWPEQSTASDLAEAIRALAQEVGQ